MAYSKTKLERSSVKSFPYLRPFLIENVQQIVLGPQEIYSSNCASCSEQFALSTRIPLNLLYLSYVP